MKASVLIRALACAPLGAVAVHAQTFNYTGGAYTQNFDSLPANDTYSNQISGRGPHSLDTGFGTTGLTGWYGVNTEAGSANNTQFRAHDGSLSGGDGRGIVSFGSTGSTDRALGALSTSNQVNAFGLYLTNGTGSTLTEFSLSYTGEQWRVGDIGLTDTLTFSYAIVPAGSSTGLLDDAAFTEVSALSFSTPFTGSSEINNTAVDGNSSAYQVPLSSIVSGIVWNAGDTLILRWTAQDLSGQDHGLAIDDLSFTAGSAVPEPATYAALLALAVLAGVALHRGRRTVQQ
ncbi:hypothetical protein OPIT5_20120 [Opitutaceae bacterium TAV5]|nr:hypothetical protein OPIT5_20120 [Opitutaceae bacterium TAV5]